MMRRRTDYRTKPANQVRNHETMRYDGDDYRVIEKHKYGKEITLVAIRTNPSKTAITNGLVRTISENTPILCLYDPDLRNPHDDPIDENIWRSALEAMMDQFKIGKAE